MSMKTRLFGSVVALGALALAGCAGQIPFTPAVTQYNTDTEKAQDSALLLNVIRASQRRPLTFFDVTSVTGSSPVSGSLGFSVPLSNLSSTAATTSPTFNLSGGPAVATAPVVTQDFYEGILAPVADSTIDLFVQRGISRDMLFNLFFQRIEISTADDVDDNSFDVVLQNHVSNPEQLHRFQRAVEVLVEAGFTTKKGDGDPSTEGPVFLPTELIGNDLVTKAAAAGVHARSVNWCDAGLAARLEIARRLADAPGAQPVDLAATLAPCRAYAAAEKAYAKTLRELGASDDAGAAKQELDRKRLQSASDWEEAMRKAHAPPYLYWIQKPAADSEISFTFDDALAVTHEAKPPSKAAPPKRPAKGPLTLDLFATDKQGSNLAAFCDAIFPADKTADIEHCKASNPKDIQISFVPRSTYSVIYYLGEVVRQGLYPDGGKAPRLIEFRKSPAYPDAANPVSCAEWRPDPADLNSGSGDPRGQGCAPLFLVEKGQRPAFLNVRYDGAGYLVPRTAGRASDASSDMTYEVMDILTELIALNRSAKDLPTSSVLTLQGLH